MLMTKFQYSAFKLFVGVLQRELGNLKTNITFFQKRLLTISLSLKFLDFLVFLLTMKHEMKTTQAVGIGWSAQTIVLRSLCRTKRQATWVLVSVVRLLRNNLSTDGLREVGDATGPCPPFCHKSQYP